jgi:NTP pyrophosphatase (non-canonical NTP hydrolase)
MEINEFAKKLYDRNVKHGKKDLFDYEFYAIALGGEAGEVLNRLKKLKRGDPNATKEDLVEETADAIIYGLLLLSELGADPEKIMLEKFEIVNKRLAAGGFHARP